MKRILFLIAMTAGQEGPSDVQKQVARIDEKDSVTSFDALSRLVDLAATSRAEVEAAAAKLPAFYQAALKDELAARDKLGAKFGAVTRLSVDWKEKAATDALTELSESAKEKITIAPSKTPASPVTLKLDDVTYLRALSALCQEAKVAISPTDGGVTITPSGIASMPGCQYRNFMVSSTSSIRTNRTEFGGKTKKTLTLSLQLSWDSKAGAVIGRDIRLTDAIDDKGNVLEAMPLEEGELGPYDDPNALDNGINVAFYGDLRLRQPGKGAASVRRVRGSIAALVPLKSTELTVLCKDGKPSPVSDDLVEMTVTELPGSAVERHPHGNQGVKVRLKAKGDLAALKKMPIGFRMKAKGADEVRTWTSGLLVDGMLEYQLYPIVTEVRRFNRAELPVYESITMVLHREFVERRIHFELKDLPLK